MIDGGVTEDREVDGPGRRMQTKLDAFGVMSWGIVLEIVCNSKIGRVLLQRWPIAAMADTPVMHLWYPTRYPLLPSGY